MNGSPTYPKEGLDRAVYSYIVTVLSSLAVGAFGTTLVLVAEILTPSGASIVYVLLVGPLGWATSSPTLRLILRLVPLRADGRVRYLWCLALTFLMVRGAEANLRSLNFLFEERLRSHPEALIPAFIVVMWYCAFFRAFVRHLRPAHWRRYSYGLFLRRFSGIADRQIGHIVMQSGPLDQFVYLVAPGRHTPDMHPMYSLFENVRSIPIWLKADNLNWENELDTLIGGAAWVVIDITEPTAAIIKECNLIKRHRKENRTLWLFRVNATETVAALVRDIFQESPPDLLISYRVDKRFEIREADRIGIQRACVMLRKHCTH